MFLANARKKVATTSGLNNQATTIWQKHYYHHFIIPEILGWGQPWMMVKRFFQKNWILIGCVWIYCFIYKIFMWHFRIGGCKTQFYTSSLFNLISYFHLTNMTKIFSKKKTLHQREHHVLYYKLLLSFDFLLDN